ncbi:LAME_0E07316g1_1 [Lachancea meyersii CBS 8951]|uniref:Copper transport protein n=1 Tax=Lachancea meyersii CBS 8951 TaxID=1266667 RepID=A0A1G4JIQ1_9SACH|nr:LAME_0E07316g1_1 [Lachancea meyersii CBS 8951]
MASQTMSDPVLRMSMGGGSTSGKTCKISMLWNWYTIDTCFISRSWRNDTRGKFAGSCIGCFLLVFVAQWLNRVSRQFDLELAKRRKFKVLCKHSGDMAVEDGSSSTLSDSAALTLQQLTSESDFMTTMKALGATLSHTWYVSHRISDEFGALEPLVRCSTSVNVYPTVLDHILRAGIFTLQWGLSYIIMLLFMYYNGYIIISCLLGALFGRLFFNFEPLTACGGATTLSSVAHDKEENDRKCCM